MLTIGIAVVFEKFLGHFIPVVLLGNLNGSERVTKINEPTLYQKRNNRQMVILATEYSSRRYRDHYAIYRPNTGKQSRRESGEEIGSKYRRATVEEAESWWNEHYDASLEQCSHQYWLVSSNQKSNIILSINVTSKMAFSTPVVSATPHQLGFQQVMRSEPSTLG